jgi:hypothetical protein
LNDFRHDNADNAVIGMAVEPLRSPGENDAGPLLFQHSPDAGLDTWEVGTLGERSIAEVEQNRGADSKTFRGTLGLQRSSVSQGRSSRDCRDSGPLVTVGGVHQLDPCAFARVPRQHWRDRHFVIRMREDGDDLRSAVDLRLHHN